MIIVIDNYDSFTFNLVRYLEELGAFVRVFKNDEISLTQIKRLNPRGILVSPGPCTPNEAGISLEVIKLLATTIPTMGVCLGHQSIGQVFGGKIVRAKKPMHGKVSAIYHHGKGLFKQLPSPFNATRYHSLVVEHTSLPDCLEISAWTLDDNDKFEEIMGLKHKSLPIEGVQFHPESLLTQYGKDMLANFLNEIHVHQSFYNIK